MVTGVLFKYEYKQWDLTFLQANSSTINEFVALDTMTFMSTNFVDTIRIRTTGVSVCFAFIYVLKVSKMEKQERHQRWWRSQTINVDDEVK